jgi:parallel beta helix pectate lyase-like protein
MNRHVMLAVSALGLLPVSAAATTRRVPSDHPTIQAAIDAAAPGDSVLVAPGTYDENLDTGGKNLVLISEAGAEATVVDGGRRNRVLLLEGGDVVVDGFTLRNGQAQDGGGIYVTGSGPVAIRNNIIEQNRAGYFVDSGNGGGLLVESASSVLLENNTIRDNYAGDSGGGIHAGSLGMAIRANVIEGNSCHVGGAGAIVAGATVVGNLILYNIADSFAAGLWAQANSLVESNTVVGNRNRNAFVHAAGIRGEGGTIVRRNLVVHNRSGAGISCATNEMYCNDSWGNDYGDYLVGTSCDTTGLRNFSFDPQFCDEAAGDFRISSLSGCTPELSLGCGLIGAQGVGCGVTRSAKSTWGRVKVRYR